MDHIELKNKPLTGEITTEFEKASKVATLKLRKIKNSVTESKWFKDSTSEVFNSVDIDKSGKFQSGIFEAVYL